MLLILGGGPNRIGQGIETIMVNSNPETVSTDYDTSDKLYFEPLTKEDVLHIVETESPMGIIVQFGGQTALNLSVPLFAAGIPVLGTQPQSIHRAEDWELTMKKIENRSVELEDLQETIQRIAGDP